jgi:hypothetical protein
MWEGFWKESTNIRRRDETLVGQDELAERGRFPEAGRLGQVLWQAVDEGQTRPEGTEGGISTQLH